MEKQLGQTKGCLFNLIIYTDKERRLDYYSNIVDSVIEKFPTRIIMIKSDEAISDKIKIVETNDSPNKQYIIQGSSNLLEKDPFVVLPYLIPDLPVYLIWDKDPTIQNEILTFLESISQRMIYGSECTDNLQAFSQEILNKKRTFKGELMDLDWALLGGWRDILAKSFNSKEQIESLKTCIKMTIHYNYTPSEHIYRTDTQALYLQGWLAALFEWTFNNIKKNESSTTITYKNNDLKTLIELIPQSEDSYSPGSIVSISITSHNHSECDIHISQEQSKVIVKTTTQEKCEIPFTLPLPNMQRGLAFVKELFFHQISSHYYLMLKKISEMKTKRSWW